MSASLTGLSAPGLSLVLRGRSGVPGINWLAGSVISSWAVSEITRENVRSGFRDTECIKLCYLKDQ